jgi:RimJ/RimL family protein N-acetyltransferase
MKPRDEDCSVRRREKRVKNASRGAKMPLRPATSADCRNLAEVHIASWRAAYHGIIPDHALDTLSVKAFETIWKHNLLDPNRTNVVASVEDDIVGFVSYGPSRDRDMDKRETAEIYGIYLLEGFWGGGLGLALLNLAVEDLSSTGFREASLWVLSENERARRFFERSGFSADGMKKTFARSVGADLEEVRYRKQLPLS